MLRSSLTLLLVASLLAPAAPAAAKCAPQVLTHQVVGHAADVVPLGGGILIGWDSVNYNDAPQLEGDPAARSTWRLRLGKRRVATTMTVIAPGLALYRPTKLAKTGARRYTLVGDGGATIATFKFGGKRGPTLAAPDVSSVVTAEDNRGRSVAFTTTVTLKSAPPEGAYGLVVRAAGGDAFTWGPIVDRAALTIQVYFDDGRCGRQPPAMRRPSQGESVELLWVDKFGRLSKASAAITAS